MRAAELTDRVLRCVDCEDHFLFSVGEQRFYRERGMRDEPKRCTNCRDARRQYKQRPEYRQSKKAGEVLVSAAK